MRKKPLVYAVKHKDINIRMNSRSGGFFSAVSDLVLKNGGIVYGCILTDEMNAKHIRTETIEGRDLMRGSKYIQSNMGTVFKDVKQDLNGGKLVLFSGTSCQVAGLKNLLEKDYNNLICIDIVCHGVPSSKVWQEYISWQSRKNRSKCVSVDFRDKKRFGWAAHKETLHFENGKDVSSEVFKNLFYGHEILRPSCYKCPYKSILHPGDITIADYWGIENAAPGFSDNKGVSLVLVNNDLGDRWFNKVTDKLEYVKCRIEDSMQPPLKAPFKKPQDRAVFWEEFQTKDFTYIAKKYGGYGVINYIAKSYKKVKTTVKHFLLKRLQ